MNIKNGKVFYLSFQEILDNRKTSLPSYFLIQLYYILRLFFKNCLIYSVCEVVRIKFYTIFLISLVIPFLFLILYIYIFIFYLIRPANCLIKMFFYRKPDLRSVYSIIYMFSNSFISAVIFFSPLFYLFFFFFVPVFPYFNWTQLFLILIGFLKKAYNYDSALVYNFVRVPDILKDYVFHSHYFRNNP